jgi:hypothetical protein
MNWRHSVSVNSENEYDECDECDECDDDDEAQGGSSRRSDPDTRTTSFSAMP